MTVIEDALSENILDSSSSKKEETKKEIDIEDLNRNKQTRLQIITIDGEFVDA